MRARVGTHLALHHRVMSVAAHAVAKGMQTELAVFGRQGTRAEPLDGLLVLQSIVNQIGDGAHLEPVFGGEALELGPPRHAAVLVEDLDDHRRGLETGVARVVTARLGGARAGELAAGRRIVRYFGAGLLLALGARVARDR